MDFVSTTEALIKISENQRKLCRQYAQERHKYGEAKCDLGLQLVIHQDDPRYQKASFEKQLLLLLKETPEAQKDVFYSLYKDYVKCKQNYKGLDKMIQRNSEQISWTQSMLKFAREND